MPRPWTRACSHTKPSCRKEHYGARSWNQTQLQILCKRQRGLCNKHTEISARTSSVSAGLPLSNLTLKRGVAESVPVEDKSMDVVIGNLVLCSVSNTDMALRDGSFLRFVQGGALDPLQQFVADGCHLTRTTGENIRDVEFSSLNIQSVRLSNAFSIIPHAYGVACK